MKDKGRSDGQRTKCAIEEADELVEVGYSLPAPDERARAMLLSTANKAVRLSIRCGGETASLALEFRDHGFMGTEAVAPTLDGFPTCGTAGGGTDTGAPISHKTRYNCFMETLSRLNDLIGKQGLLKIRFSDEVGFTFLSVYPAPDLPTEADDEVMLTAIIRSQYLVRFDEGNLIDGSDTRVISGRDISRIWGRY